MIDRNLMALTIFALTYFVIAAGLPVALATLTVNAALLWLEL
jgi:hypothetical protein